MSTPTKPPPPPIKSHLHPENSIVLFDLETTGLQPNCEIFQISAKHGDKIYNVYILPTELIPEVNEATGLSIINNRMLINNKEVETVSRVIALENFLQFLELIGGKVILVAHNCFGFDGPMLVGMVNKERMMGRFQKIVYGFSDTLPLFRQLLPGRSAQGKSCGLVSLTQDFLGGCAGAHDAVNDVISLERLIMNERIPINGSDIVLGWRSIEDMNEKFSRNWRLYHENPRPWNTWK